MWTNRARDTKLEVRPVYFFELLQLNVCKYLQATVLAYELHRYFYAELFL